MAGLTEPPGAEAHMPVPANIAGFLEHGVQETGRWRVPLIFRLAPGVGIEDVRAVLTALANHHDALRVQLVDRAGNVGATHRGTAGIPAARRRVRFRRREGEAVA